MSELMTPESRLELQSQRIKMKIVSFRTSRPHKGRRGSPAIPSNTLLYAIAYLHVKGGFYTYSYINRTDAVESIENMKLQQTDNEFYYPWNVVYDVENTMHHGELKTEKS